MEYFTIGEFAKYCGTTVEFLKYYDKVGLLSPVDYDEAGHRLYASYQTVDLAELYKLSRMGFSLKQAKHIQGECSLDDYETLLSQQRKKLQMDISDKQAALQNLEESLNAIAYLRKDDYWLIQPMEKAYFFLPNTEPDPHHSSIPWWKTNSELPEYWQRIAWSSEKGIFPLNDSQFHGYGWGNLCYDRSKVNSSAAKEIVSIPEGRCFLCWYSVPTERDDADAHLVEKSWSLEKPLAILEKHHLTPIGDIYKRQLFITHEDKIPYLHFMVRIPLR